MFCKHEWELLSETLMKSALETCSGIVNGTIYSRSRWGDPDQKLVQIVACGKCGKLRKLVTSTNAEGYDEMG